MYIQVDLDILDVTNDQGKIVVNVQLTNSSTKAVKLPQRSYQDLFTCSLKPVNSGAHVANLEIICRKTTKMDNLELIEVEPNKSVEYKVELDSFFILNTLKLVNDLHILRMRFSGLLFSESQTIRSNFVQKELLLRISDQNDERKIEGISVSNEEISRLKQ